MPKEGEDESDRRLRFDGHSSGDGKRGVTGPRFNRSMPSTSQAPEAPSQRWPASTHDWTWPEIVRHVLSRAKGTVALAELYARIESHPRTARNRNWQARTREVLESHDEFVRVSRGIWSLAKRFSARKVKALHRLRTKECPPLGPREE